MCGICDIFFKIWDRKHKSIQRRDDIKLLSDFYIPHNEVSYLKVDCNKLNIHFLNPRGMTKSIKQWSISDEPIVEIRYSQKSSN